MQKIFTELVLGRSEHEMGRRDDIDHMKFLVKIYTFSDVMGLLFDNVTGSMTHPVMFLFLGFLRFFLLFSNTENMNPSSASNCKNTFDCVMHWINNIPNMRQLFQANRRIVCFR